MVTTMGDCWSSRTLAAVMTLVCLATVDAGCPHTDPGLKRWSDASTWGGTKPEGGKQVILTSSMRVLLDESTPSLGSITVESGARIVWDDKADITLTVSYVLVRGEFHVGSDDCRFTKKANIVLTGLSNSTLNVPGFGRKFIGVAAGGVLELHGREKTSWTKLATSIPAADQTCGVVYNHKKTPYYRERGMGLHVVVWNLNGSLYDFGAFYTGENWHSTADKNLVKFLKIIPKNKVVALGVMRRLGIKSKRRRNWKSVFSAIETLGGLTTSRIRKVKDFESYAFITITGNPKVTMEQHVAREKDGTYTQTDDVHVVLWETHLKFAVESAISTRNRRRPNGVNFRVTSTEISYPKIDVINDVSSWQTGDRVVFTSTDFHWKQAEEFEVFACDDCASNQFRVKGEFKFPHYGKVYDGVDMRGEVALLSRDFVIEGEMETGCYVTETNRKKEKWLCSLFNFDHFGGHLKVTKGFASAHIQGIEFYHMGQQEFTGSYPIHFHMCDDVNGTWVRSNSIHHSLARCVTIHGTDGLEVSDNACYDHLGHGYFLEDSVEQYNILDGNIGIGTKHGTHIMTDMKNRWCNKTLAWNCNSLATFWITHFNNYIRNNVAAGSDNAGFWLNYADSPLGPSAARQAEKLANNQPAVTKFSTRHTPILEFNNNVAHSNHERGLMFENRISNGHWEGKRFIPENARFGSIKYDPRRPSNSKGKPVTTTINRLTVYKNRVENVWLRAANTILVNCSIADSQRGLSMPMSRGNRFNEVKNSVFIGMSDNKGVGKTYRQRNVPGRVKPVHKFDRSLSSRPTDPLQGFVFYRGPSYVTDCYFNDFYNWHWNSTWDSVFKVPGYRTGGALGFRRTNMPVFNPRSTVSGLKFGFCDKTEGNRVFDGNKTTPGFGRDGEGKQLTSIHDVDGSVTGMINSQVVKNNPFFTTPKCSVRDNWGMAVCPYKYVKIFVIARLKVPRDHKPLYFVRDDAHAHTFSLALNQGRGYHFIVNKTYTVHFKTKVPRVFKMHALNMERGDSVRVGVCVPKDMTKFALTSSYPRYNRRRRPVKVATIKELDADTSGMAYFWDKKIGMIFVKLMSNETRADRQMLCPNGKCPNFRIVRRNGRNTADCRKTAYGPYVKQPEVAGEDFELPACAKASSQGLGAGETRPATVALSTARGEDHCPPLSQPAPAPLPSQSRGCAVDTRRRDMGDMTIGLHRSMTRGFCVQRCGQNGYRYAGLQNSNECWCSDSFGLYGSGEGCTKECSAKTGRFCGGGWRNEVFTTSADDNTALTSCGPGSRGMVWGGKCYYFGDERLNFINAQRACVRMNGDLATISSAAEQTLFRGYLGQSESDIWIGLTDVAKEGEFVFMDGTPATYINGDLKHDAVRHYDDFVTMVVRHGYRWDDRSWRDAYRYLCQLPLKQTTSFESCGPNGAGHRLGSNGKCYLILNTKTNYDTAEYQCLTRQGVLPTVTDDVTQREIRNLLLMFGDDISYWTGEAVKVDGDKRRDTFYVLTLTSLFNKKHASGKTRKGTLCLLESSKSTSECPSAWKKHAGSCYLYTGKTASHYDTVAALCNQGDSNMVTVHSKTENDFVYNMVKDFHKGEEKDVLIGYRYRSVFDKFTWLDGSDPVYENWSDGHGMSGLTGGYCTKICYHDNKITWRNTACTGSKYAAVCKMTLRPTPT
ncbi:cell surface hyaluronidase-like [Haliotis rufescens]|uniref:cell surface hyaluronidase-like n=1 Tax=Haliotis rufescens TaxID=6454 RepID=UPI00201E9EC1|nr:cell surface hyaluronidase-like [Haliotis rufescens]